MVEDFYKILGVSKDSDHGTIKKAYRKLARKWHPDINPGNKDAEQKFKDISRAYDCLGDKEKRKRYDEFGEDGLQAPEASSAESGGFRVRLCGHRVYPSQGPHQQYDGENE